MRAWSCWFSGMPLGQTLNSFHTTPGVKSEDRTPKSASTDRPICVVVTAFSPVPSMAGSHMRVASNNPRPETRFRPSRHLHRQSTSNDLSGSGLLPKQRDPLHARPQGFRSRKEGVSCRDNSVCHRMSLAAIRSHVCTRVTLSRTSHCAEC